MPQPAERYAGERQCEAYALQPVAPRGFVLPARTRLACVYDDATVIEIDPAAWRVVARFDRHAGEMLAVAGMVGAVCEKRYHCFSQVIRPTDGAARNDGSFGEKPK